MELPATEGDDDRSGRARTAMTTLQTGFLVVGEGSNTGQADPDAKGGFRRYRPQGSDDPGRARQRRSRNSPRHRSRKGGVRILRVRTTADAKDEGPEKGSPQGCNPQAGRSQIDTCAPEKKKAASPRRAASACLRHPRGVIQTRLIGPPPRSRGMLPVGGNAGSGCGRDQPSMPCGFGVRFVRRPIDFCPSFDLAEPASAVQHQAALRAAYPPETRSWPIPDDALMKPGHRPKFLVIIDETHDAPARSASRRGAWRGWVPSWCCSRFPNRRMASNGSVLGDVMRAEAEEEAQERLEQAAEIAREAAGVQSEHAIRMGAKTEEIL